MLKHHLNKKRTVTEMAIRRQTIEQRFTGATKELKRNGRGCVFVTSLDMQMCKTPSGHIFMVSATEFLVINKLLLSPTIKSTKDSKYVRDYKGWFQLRVNTTNYFVNEEGISNKALNSEDNILDPSVYVLPGQSFGIILTLEDDEYLKKDEYIDIGIGYILYDNTDGVHANHLLENGYDIIPANLDAIRRAMIENEPWDTYLKQHCGHPSYVIVTDVDDDLGPVFKLRCVHCKDELPFSCCTADEWDDEISAITPKARGKDLDEES